jgi:hypothetical protein
MTKTCTRCKQEKPTTEFYANKMTVRFMHGVDYYCKQCRIQSHKTSLKTNERKCTVDGCTRPHYAKDICQAHYEKARRDKAKENNK